jgi:DNA end-binding protein Ku
MLSKKEAEPMPQAVWTGTLTFGLVSIPVKLFGATTPRDVRFHQFEGRTGRRIRYRRVAAEALEPPPDDARWSSLATEPPSEEGTPGPPEPAPPPSPEERPTERTRRPEPETESEVPFHEVVKGYEVEPGRFVMVEPEELRALAPQRSQAIEIEDFVDISEIDPVYFERSYHVAPAARDAALRPYWLLYRAMEDAGRVGIGRFVLRTKEHLAAIRPARGILMLETLFHADEVRDPAELWIPPAQEPHPREVEMATRLIEALTVEWDPQRYRDIYRERVEELIRGKAAGGGVLAERPEEPVGPGVGDIMAALKESLEAAKRRRAAEDEANAPAKRPRPRKRGTG